MSLSDSANTFIRGLRDKISTRDSVPPVTGIEVDETISIDDLDEGDRELIAALRESFESHEAKKANSTSSTAYNTVRVRQRIGAT